MRNILILLNLILLASCSSIEKNKTQKQFQEEGKNFFTRNNLEIQTYKKYSHISYINNFENFDYCEAVYYLNDDNTKFITSHTYNTFYKAIYYFFNSDSESISNNKSKDGYTSSFWNKQQLKTSEYNLYQLKKIPMENIIIKNLFEDSDFSIPIENYSLYQDVLKYENLSEETQEEIDNSSEIYYLLKEQEDSLFVLPLFKLDSMLDGVNYSENTYISVFEEPFVMKK